VLYLHRATIGRAGLVAGLALCILGAVPAGADACSCIPSCWSGGPKTLFEGTVTAIEQNAGPEGYSIVRLADVRSILGGAAPAMIITGSEASCGYQFVVGVRYLVDAFESAPGRFGASLCSRTRPSAGATDLLDYLLAPTAAARPRVWGTVGTRRAAPGIDSRAGGTPIAGAVVTLRGRLERRTTSAANGTFRFMGVPDGAYKIIVALPAHRTDVEAPPSYVFTLSKETACVTHDLLAASTARASGIVLTTTGTPAAGVRVELFPLPYDRNARGFATAATTNANGRYEIERIAPGTYGGGVDLPHWAAVEPYAPARARDQIGSDEIVVAPGAAIELLPITVQIAPLMTVSGVVVDTPNLSLEGLDVTVLTVEGFRSAWRTRATTGRSGQFTIEVNRGVNYEALVERNGRIIGRLVFVAGDAPITLRVDLPR
jgi:hypothetical protein